MMIRDSERREVARSLRGARYGWRSWERALYDALGVDPETAGLDMLDRLADLIEPTRNCSEPTRTYGECDRDALLELVKELELGAQCVVGRKWPDVECERMAKHLADDYEMIASRIRESLGVVDE